MKRAPLRVDKVRLAALRIGAGAFHANPERLAREGWPDHCVCCAAGQGGHQGPGRPCACLARDRSSPAGPCHFLATIVDLHEPDRKAGALPVDTLSERGHLRSRPRRVQASAARGGRGGSRQAFSRSADAGARPHQRTASFSSTCAASTLLDERERIRRAIEAVGLGTRARR